MAIDSIGTALFDTIGFILYYISIFTIWFYSTFLPFILQYIGIPLFVLGLLAALAFAGGTVLCIVVFFILMYYFIKEVIFKSKPNKLKT
jgi:hypothetical protein